MNRWKTKGAYENFGQKEVRKLEDKFKINHHGDDEERQIADIIQSVL